MMGKRMTKTSKLDELREVARSTAEEISRIETAEKLERAMVLRMQRQAH